MSHNHFNLKGKNALVTGSNRGLGAGMSIGLAEVGTNVPLLGMQPVPADVQVVVDKTSVKNITVLGDVADKNDCAEIVEQAVAGLGSIDILVNNVGIIRRMSAVVYSAINWQDGIEVNLSSVFRLYNSQDGTCTYRDIGRSSISIPCYRFKAASMAGICRG